MKNKIKILLVVILMLALSLTAAACSDKITAESSPEETLPVEPEISEEALSDLNHALYKISEAIPRDGMTGDLTAVLGDQLADLNASIEGADGEVTIKNGMILTENEGERSLIKIYNDGMLNIATDKGKTTVQTVGMDILLAGSGVALPEMGGDAFGDIEALIIKESDVIETAEKGVYDLSRDYCLRFFTAMSMDGEQMADNVVIKVDIRDYASDKRVKLRLIPIEGEEQIFIFELSEFESGKLVFRSEDDETRIEFILNGGRLSSMSVKGEADGGNIYLEVILAENGGLEMLMQLDAEGQSIELDLSLRPEKFKQIGGCPVDLQMTVSAAGNSAETYLKITTESYSDTASRYSVSARSADGKETDVDVVSPAKKEILLSELERKYVTRGDAVFKDYAEAMKRTDEQRNQVVNSMYKYTKIDQKRYFYTYDKELDVAYVTEVVKKKATTRLDIDYESEAYTHYFYEYGDMPKPSDRSAAQADAAAVNAAVDAMLNGITPNYEIVHPSTYKIYFYKPEADRYVVMSFGDPDNVIWHTEPPKSSDYDNAILHEFKKGEPLHDFEIIERIACEDVSWVCKDCSFEIKNTVSLHNYGEAISETENGRTLWDLRMCEECDRASLTVYASDGSALDLRLRLITEEEYKLFGLKSENIFTKPFSECGNTLVITDIYFNQKDHGGGDHGGGAPATEIVIPNITEKTGYEIVGVVDGVRKIDGKLKLTLPEGVRVLGEMAFYDYFYGVKDIVGITLPESLIYIGEKAFEGSSVTELTIPAGVERIDDNFTVDTLLKLTVLPKSLPSLTVVAINLKELDLRSTVKDFGGLGSMNFTDYTVPYGVDRIIPGGFSDNPYLKRVVLPSTVTAIAARAFENSTALEELVIPDSIESIGESAFSMCKSLITIMTEKDGIIEGEKGTVLLPRGLTSLGSYSFCDNKMMEKIVLRGNIKHLNKMFTRCERLSSVVFETESLISIESCFNECTALPELRIPEGVTSLGIYAIVCKKVYLPTSIKYIGYNALMSSHIEYAGTVAEWYKITKDNKWNGYNSNYTVICIDGQIN